MITFTELRRGHIIGIIDSYGAVHSKFTGETMSSHETIFPQKTHKKWRWSNRESIESGFGVRDRFDVEEYDAIMTHLSKKYGLKWWENGHHDLDHFNEMWKKEKNETN